MSYILDALRRSQAERERGQVPGLHAQPTVLAPAAAPPESARWAGPLPLALAAVAAALLGGALLVAVLGGWPGRSATGSAPVAGAPVQAPAAAPPQVAAEAGTPPWPRVVSAPPAPTATVSPTAPAAPAARSPQAEVAAPPSLAQPLPRPAAGLAPAVPAAARTLRLADLPAEQRRELPPLSLGGAVWSESALSRFVIVNGQVVREGDSAAPGVTVDRIGPKAVWLRWRELLLEVPI